MGEKQKYFEKRSLEDSKRVINLTEKYINQQLRKYYKLAVKEVQQQIKDFYKKYAKGENITLAEAKKQLKEVELKNIDLEKLVLETKQNPTKDMIKLINKIIKQQQISRLELLEIEIQRILRNLFNEQQISMYDYLYDTYKDSYYRSTYSLKDYNNIYTTFVKPNESLIKQAIMQKWSSKNYSERIWNHENKINEILKQHITTGLIQGNSISKMSQKVTNDMNVSLNNSIRLVRTETAYIQGKAILESYIQAGIKKYKYLATLDYKTSKVCQNLDSKIFEVEKAQIGTNYPPMHPNCRSTTVVYIDDNVESERIARGTDNKTYKVSADITYKEWYNSLVEDEQSKMILYLRRQKSYAQDVKQFENYKKVLKTKAPSSFEKFQEIKYQDDDKWDKLKSEYRKQNNIIQSGGKYTKGTYEWVIRRDTEAENFYNKIRQTKEDISKISKNTGWSIKSIKQIKNHVFYNEHILYDGSKGLLDADYDMAVAWQRLINGNYENRDILLLKHEYLESIVESRYNISNKEAHEIVSKKHDWYGELKSEKGEYGEDDCLNDIIS